MRRDSPPVDAAAEPSTSPRGGPVLIEIKGVQFENKGAELMLLAVLGRLRREWPALEFALAPNPNADFRRIAGAGGWQRLRLDGAQIDIFSFSLICSPLLFFTFFPFFFLPHPIHTLLLILPVLFHCSTSCPLSSSLSPPKPLPLLSFLIHSIPFSSTVLSLSPTSFCFPFFSIFFPSLFFFPFQSFQFCFLRLITRIILALPFSGTHLFSFLFSNLSPSIHVKIPITSAFHSTHFPVPLPSPSLYPFLSLQFCFL